MLEVLLTPHPMLILKSTHGHSSWQYYSNGTLQVSRQKLTYTQDFTPDVLPVTTLPVNSH